MNVDNLLLFLDFVADRHHVWELRQQGAAQPWSADPILQAHKFTNVYRVLDPGSQFVFELAGPDDDPRDVFARLFLYRYTNLPAAWYAYASDTGYMPGVDDLEELRTFWDGYRASGSNVFSGAYVILPQPNRSGDKVHQAIELTQRAVKESFTDFMLADTQLERLNALRSHYGVGDFMAMQILTDWGYTPQCGEDREDEFVIAGPGSKRGCAAIGATIEQARQTVLDDVGCPELPLDSVGENYRQPSLMDVQNCLCEFSKYVRYLGKPTPTKQYRPAHPGPQEEPILPDHWR